MEKRYLGSHSVIGFILLLNLGGKYLDIPPHILCTRYILLLEFSTGDTLALLSRQSNPLRWQLLVFHVSQHKSPLPLHTPPCAPRLPPWTFPVFAETHNQWWRTENARNLALWQDKLWQMRGRTQSIHSFFLPPVDYLLDNSFMESLWGHQGTNEH